MRRGAAERAGVAPRLAAALWAAGLLGAPLLAQEWRGVLGPELRPPARVAAYLPFDVDGDRRAELVVVTREGGVAVFRRAADSARLEGGGGLVLPRPDFSALALADLDGDRRAELVVFDDRGVAAYALGDGATFASEPSVISASPRLRIRLGRPAFVDFVHDLDGDRRPDLALPIADTCEIWSNRSGGGTTEPNPRFELVQTVPVRMRQQIDWRAPHLAATYRNELSLPRLDVADVNGDGRPDLRSEEGTKRRFFLQGADGRFSTTPIEVDLSLFRDTTPRARVEIGGTLVVGDKQQMQAGDLNADGIPDYVIAHRRKVWSFLSGKDGPQFRRADTRIVAEDISWLLLAHLDDDDRVDLLVLKIDLPATIALVLGLLGSIDLPVAVLGYRTGEDGTFERRAAWSRKLTVRVPSLLRLIGTASDLLEDVMGVLSKLRWSAVGDFDGDGRRDLALLSEDEAALELWLGPPNAPAAGRETASWLRRLLFEDPDTVFDVDRLLKLAGQVFDARTAAMTGRRAADARIELPLAPGERVRGLLTADFDGTGRAELVLVLGPDAAPGQIRFLPVRWLRS